jgi:hypothetical protein
MYTLKLGMRLLHLAVIVSFILPAPAQAGVLLLQEAEEMPTAAETITPTAIRTTPTTTGWRSRCSPAARRRTPAAILSGAVRRGRW